MISLFSCAPKPDEISKSKVTVRLPASVNQSELRHYKTAGSTLSTLDDIDCYAIVVSWYDNGFENPDPLPPPGACLGGLPAGSVALHGVRAVFGAIPDGDVLEVEVASGPAREFQILGFSYFDPMGVKLCPDFKNLTLSDRTEMSDAVYVGGAKADLLGGEIELPITISMTGSVPLDKCEGGPFNWAISHEALWDSASWDEAVWGN